MPETTIDLKTLLKSVQDFAGRLEKSNDPQVKAAAEQLKVNLRQAVRVHK